MSDRPPSSRSRWRAVVSRALLIVAGIAAAVAISELVARITWRPAPQPAKKATQDRRDDLPVIEGIRALARPNVRGVMPNGTFYRTNSAGFRGREHPREAPPGTFRVGVIGDSVTMGVGVEEEDTYPAVLEARLSERPGEARYEVLNFALAGINIAQIVERLDRLVLPFNPMLLIYGWTINDIQGPAYERTRERSDRASVLRNRHRERRFEASPSYLLRLVWPRWLLLRRLWSPDPDSYLAELERNYLGDSAAWKDFESGLDRFAFVGEARQICVVVFIHTHLTHLNMFHPLRPMYDRVAGAAEARGLSVIRSFTALRGRDERGLTVGPFDPHPNAAGHEIFAKVLLDGLGALPARCWQPISTPRDRG